MPRVTKEQLYGDGFDIRVTDNADREVEHLTSPVDGYFQRTQYTNGRGLDGDVSDALLMSTSKPIADTEHLDVPMTVVQETVENQKTDMLAAGLIVAAIVIGHPILTPLGILAVVGTNMLRT